MNIIEKFIKWLDDEPTRIKLFNFIILSAVYYHLYLLFIFFCFPEIKHKLSMISSAHSADIISKFTVVSLSLFLKALWEEFVFRFLPLWAGLRIFGLSYKILLVAFIASVIFGLLHGNIYHIYIQGFSGLCLSVVFLKCGGLHKKYGKALLCSTVVHATMNYNIISSLVIRSL